MVTIREFNGFGLFKVAAVKYKNTCNFMGKAVYFRK